MWTDERVEELKQMWTDHSASEIAAKFGVSRNSVIGKIHRIQTQPDTPKRRRDPRHWRDEALAIVREYWHGNSSGVIVAALAERGFVYSRQAVLMKGVRLGLPPKGKGGVKRMSPTTITRRKVGFYRGRVSPRPPVTEPESLNLPLVALGADQCRWTNGDGPFLFCGHPVEDGRSYCPHHYARTIRIDDTRPSKKREAEDYFARL